MQVAADRDALHEALTFVLGAVPSKCSMAILQGRILVQPEDGALRVSASNLDVSLSATMAADAAAGAGIAVPSMLLCEFVKGLRKGSAVTLADGAEGAIVLKSGRSRATVQTLDGGAWPQAAAVTGAMIEIDAEKLCAAFGSVQHAVYVGQARPQLAGVFLQARQVAGSPILSAVGTDGNRLFRSDVGAPPVGFPAAGIMISSDAARQFERLLRGRESLVRVGLDGSRISVEVDGRQATGRLIESQLPNYEAHFPGAGATEIVIDRDEFLSCVSRAAPFVEQRSFVRILIADNAMRVIGKTITVGEIEDEIEVDYAGETIATGFAAKYLIDALKGLKCDRIVLSIPAAASGRHNITLRPYEMDTSIALIARRVGEGSAEGAQQ